MIATACWPRLFDAGVGFVTTSTSIRMDIPVVCTACTYLPSSCSRRLGDQCGRGDYRQQTLARVDRTSARWAAEADATIMRFAIG
jgi:hypothetical protein